jgi:hypothetical protein
MDVYNAVWLVAASAKAVEPANLAKMKLFVDRYAQRVKELGYPEMQRRYEALLVTQNT